jgi:hypothetical protein
MTNKHNLDKASRFGADWYDVTVIRRRAAGTNSRARRMGARGQITADELAKKLAATKGKCSACRKLFGPQRRDKWIICFRVPLSMGGECKIANTGIICRQCEMERAATLGVKWEGSGRAHARAARTAPQAPLPPGPAKSSGTLLRMFVEPEEEDDDT